MRKHKKIEKLIENYHSKRCRIRGDISRLLAEEEAAFQEMLNKIEEVNNKSFIQFLGSYEADRNCLDIGKHA